MLRPTALRTKLFTGYTLAWTRSHGSTSSCIRCCSCRRCSSSGCVQRGVFIFRPLHPQRRNTCTHTPLIFASPRPALVTPQFVYEPHIAPTLEAWAEDFLERRRAARNRRASAVPVRTSRRRNSSSPSNSSHHDNDPPRPQGGDRAPVPNDLPVDAFELEALPSREVDEWRNEVLRSQERTNNGLRRRTTSRLRDEFEGFDILSTTLDEVSARSSCLCILASSI